MPKLWHKKRISIHAPTRGATDGAEIDLRKPVISIHAPTRGATKWEDICRDCGYISIHAPTRGATHCHNKTASNTFISIHAPTRGATKAGDYEIPNLIPFQSTLPREERRDEILITYHHSVDFNPRSHERSDGNVPTNWNVYAYFNPRSHERSDGFFRLKRLYLY